MNNVELDQLYQQGVAAIRAGDKAKALELLGKVVEQDQLHEQAWLWLSAAVETSEERVLCLKNVLTINPQNETAIKGLEKLDALPPASSDDRRPDWLRGMSGQSSEAPPSEPPTDPVTATDAPQESWRKKLYEDATYTVDALIVKDKDVAPPRTFSDLVGAWLSAFIFKIPGDYQDEVDYGALGHIAINVGVSVLLQALAIVLFFGILAATNRNPSYLFDAVARSNREMSQAAARVSLANLAPESLRPALGILFSSASGVRIPVLSAALLASFGTLLVAVLVWNILSTFVFLMFQSLVVSRVSEWLGGKGNVFATTLGLSLALVTSALINLPLAMIAAVVPFQVLFTLLAISAVYQFAQTGLAISAAHRLNILASLGAVVISDVVTNVGLSCAVFLLAYLIAAGGAR